MFAQPSLSHVCSLFLKVGQKDAGEQPVIGSSQVHPGTKEQIVVLLDRCPLTAPSAGVLSSLDTVLRAAVNGSTVCHARGTALSE